MNDNKGHFNNGNQMVQKYSEENKTEEMENDKNEESKGGIGTVTANIYQAAILNKLLPRGFRIEVEESALRTLQQR